jgi:hypothetical protein
MTEKDATIFLVDRGYKPEVTRYNGPSSSVVVFSKPYTYDGKFKEYAKSRFSICCEIVIDGDIVKHYTYRYLTNRMGFTLQSLPMSVLDRKDFDSIERAFMEYALCLDSYDPFITKRNA